jgi:hypothetical protein
MCSLMIWISPAGASKLSSSGAGGRLPSQDGFEAVLVWGYYLNRVQSSRRLEREAQRNVELMWLTERLEDTIVAISVPGC